MSRLVDVIIPCHNRSDLSAITLRNVLLAEGVELNVYAVDDGSSDNTLDILSAIDDPRLHIHHFETPRGASSARNYGFLQGDSPYVCFLDSDDLLHPEKLSRQVDLLEQETDKDFAVCQMGHFENDPNESKFLWNTFAGTDPKLRFLLHDALWGMHAPLWRRGALEKVAASRTAPMVLDDSLPMAQDYELHARALALGLKPILTSELLCFCRQHAGPSIGSSSKIKRYETLLQVFDSLFPLAPDASHAINGNYWWIATLAAILGQPKIMRTALSHSHGTSFRFRLLCQLTAITKRHRFFAWARAEALKQGHNLSLREDWHSHYRVDAEPGLKRFEMPPGSF